MSIHDIPAIDVHAHYGKVNWGNNEVHNRFTTAAASTVLQRSLDSNIQYTIVSPLLGLRIGYDVIAANIEAAKIMAETEGLF